jgi:hypothetical protein
MANVFCVEILASEGVLLLTESLIGNKLTPQMQFPVASTFVDRESGAKVPGLIRLATEQDLLLWTGWRYRPLDEDGIWDWWGIYRESMALRDRYECYAAFAANDLQGLMALDLKARGTSGGNAITIDYLSTNPTNRKSTEGLKHVGLALIAVAIVRSMEYGAEGWIWLESLPGAAGFYENLGMARQPGRSPEGNLMYELELKTAKQLLEEIKNEGIIKL